MANSRLKGILRTISCTVALILAALYVYATLRAPDGVPAVLENQRRIRELQEQNASLKQEIDRKRDRIRRLKEDRSEQELQIRQRLKLLKEKETTFIIRDQPQ